MEIAVIACDVVLDLHLWKVSVLLLHSWWWKGLGRFSPFSFPWKFRLSRHAKVGILFEGVPGPQNCSAVCQVLHFCSLSGSKSQEKIKACIRYLFVFIPCRTVDYGVNWCFCCLQVRFYFHRSLSIQFYRSRSCPFLRDSMLKLFSSNLNEFSRFWKISFLAAAVP